MAVPAFLFALFGLAVGSFLNVVIYRVPRRQSIAVPPSHCPHCGVRLGPAELVPLFSFAWQRGRCRHCGGPIGWRYPAVEALTGLLFVLAYLRFGWTGLALYWSVFSALLVVVACIDWEHRIIPNVVLGAGLALGLVITLVLQLPLPAAAMGLASGFSIFLLLAAAWSGAMGAGDVKLAGVLGWYLGWPLVVVGLFGGVLSGALVGLILLITRRKAARDQIPLGPFLALGALLAVFFGRELLDWYLPLLRW